MSADSQLVVPTASLSYRDEPLDLHALKQYDLRIELDAGYLRYAVLRAQDARCLLLEEYTWPQELPESERLAYLRGLMEHHEVLPRNFWHSVQVLVDNPSFTLVPAPLYRKEYALKYLELARGTILAHEAVRHQRHADWNLVNVFSLPMALHDYLAGLYPFDTFRVVHHTDLLLDVARPAAEPTFLIALEPDSLTLCYAEDGRLMYCNRFGYQDVKDLIYYVLLVMSELKLNAAQVPVRAFGDIDEGSDAHIALHKYLGQLHIGLPDAVPSPGPHWATRPAHRYLTLFHAVETPALG
jgi:hypothetical protein